MIGDSKQYYQILGVKPMSGSEEIKQHYRELAKKWHPDCNPNNPEAIDVFQKISVAYDVLKDDNSRLLYDILSQAYDTDTFPDMYNLKIYTNRHGDEEVDIRTIRLTEVIGKIYTYKENKLREICNFSEARKLALKVSIKNWLFGWWSFTGIIANIKAISNNYSRVLSDYKGNFTLLAHNMLAYNQEKRYDEAYASGRLALRYSTPYQKQLLTQYMDTIPYQRDYIYPQWRLGTIKLFQLIAPLFFFVELLIASSTQVVTIEEFAKIWTSNNNINYFQEVRFSGGGSTVDDMVVSKVVSIPVDTDEIGNLYHLSSDSKIMYGPDNNFDVLTTLPALSTVRLTGYTPDEKWARIMIDSGEMGFILRTLLNQGIGNPIPDDSRIYTGIRP